MIWSTRTKRASVPLFATALTAALVAVASPSAEAATGVSIQGGSCTLLNGSGQTVTITDVKTFKNKKIKVWKCKGKVTPATNKNGKAKAASFSGRKTGTTCTTDKGTTTRWHQTISASGRTTLVCHYR